MFKNLLILPKNSLVTSTPISFSGNTNYKVTIGGFKGNITFLILDYANGLSLAERTITGNGTDVSFDYFHINHWPATGSSIISLEGNLDSETTSFRVDKY